MADMNQSPAPPSKLNFDELNKTRDICELQPNLAPKLKILLESLVRYPQYLIQVHDGLLDVLDDFYQIGRKAPTLESSSRLTTLDDSNTRMHLRFSFLCKHQGLGYAKICCEDTGTGVLKAAS